MLSIVSPRPSLAQQRRRYARVELAQATDGGFATDDAPSNGHASRCAEVDQTGNQRSYEFNTGHRILR